MNSCEVDISLSLITEIQIDNLCPKTWKEQETPAKRTLTQRSQQRPHKTAQRNEVSFRCFFVCWIHFLVPFHFQSTGFVNPTSELLNSWELPTIVCLIEGKLET
jgi:hypothetical protein